MQNDMDLLPTEELDSIWPSLLECWGDLQAASRGGMAAPFFSAASATYPTYRHRFMMVGRATAGSFWRQEFDVALADSQAAALLERKRLNRDRVVNHSRSSAFWRSLSFGANAFEPTDGLENVVWSNLGKIGYCENRKDIDDDLFQKQSAVSENLLRAELDAYQPTVIHLAVGTLGSKAILAVTGSSESDWQRDENDPSKGNIWTLEQSSRLFLWTRHPNRALPAIKSTWEDKIVSFVQS